ncbi:MAG: PilZ domain-containing protein [bacterium]
MRSAELLPDEREQRRHDRLFLDTEVRYKVVQRRRSPAGANIEGFRPDGRSLNISLRGLSIATDAPLNKGDYLKLELKLPDRVQPIQALAEVVWTVARDGRNASGIRFLIFLNQSDDALVRRFVGSAGPPLP